MRSYDFIFSMGGSCHCSQILRAAGLQLASFPLDWVAGPPMPQKTAFMVDGFPGWFEAENLIPVDSPCTTALTTAWTDRQGFTIVHDFHRGIAFERELPLVQAKYRRRIDRLMRLIGGSRRVLVVYLEAHGHPMTSPEELAGTVRPILNRRWPEARFDFLLIRCRRTGDREPEVSDLPEGVRLAVFDDDPPETVDWRPDFDRMSRWLRGEYSVVDYRTEDERRSRARKARQTKYASLNATGPVSYLVNSWQYRLYRHLHKRLSAKGIV